ncbi:MAG: PilZ domain-containing protein [Gemmatimonadota bacterium]|nr:PilZ domain-containing protein [Gemmatimonadota bacterium]
MTAEKKATSADNRAAPRYRMDAPVEFIIGNGMTRDLSTTGVYFICERPLQVGIRLSLTIEVDDTMADRPVKMQRWGTIVRVEDHDGKIGVAVHLDDEPPPPRKR